jgi:hypothetical protein
VTQIASNGKIIPAAVALGHGGLPSPGQAMRIRTDSKSTAR